MTKKTRVEDVGAELLEQFVEDRLAIRESDNAAVVEVLADQQETIRMGLDVLERCVSKICDTFLETEKRRMKMNVRLSKSRRAVSVPDAQISFSTYPPVVSEPVAAVASNATVVNKDIKDFVSANKDFVSANKDFVSANKTKKSSKSSSK